MRLDVAMNDKVAMRIADFRAYALKQLEPLRNRQLALIAVEVNRLTLDVFHDEVGQAVVGRASIEQAGDVGMVEHGQNPALTVKPIKDVVGIQTSADDFDGNEFLKGVVGAGS